MSRFLRPAAFVIALGVLHAGCGGNEGATPPPAASPSPAVQNPCPSPGLDPSSERDIARRPPEKLSGGLGDPDPRSTIFDVLWTHGAGSRRLAPASVVNPRASQDLFDVAVIQDEGDLIGLPNPFDLQSAALRYVPRLGGGYDVLRTDSTFRQAIGDRLMLGDDDSVEARLPFTLTFFGRPQTVAFVNSDGNITFGEADRSSSARSIARLMEGAPRIAPFLADLDPSTGGGGSVFARAAADGFTATWCGVRVFDSSRLVTMQTSAFPDGTIEMKYAGTPPWTATDGIVGLSPGRTGAFLPLDLSTTASGAVLAGNAGAIGERFAQRAELDLVSVARKFYLTHADNYDQLVIWTDQALAPEGAFSFEVTVANEIAGIGVNRYDTSSEFGSAGRRLRSLVQMDDISKFPDDPAQKFLGENTTLSVLGQEVGHRWLAFLSFSDHNHMRSDALLGRDKAHWSFFFNSDASVMEGNRIEDLGGGSFKTVAAVEKYSLLDQYAMGLVRDIDVTPMFYVESPVNILPLPRLTPEAPPIVGVTFNGTRRDVLINDVLEAMGPRQPPAADSSKVHRQAFLFVVGNGRTANLSTVAKIERVRLAWEAFFSRATDGRGRAETRLSAPF